MLARAKRIRKALGDGVDRDSCEPLVLREAERVRGEALSFDFNAGERQDHTQKAIKGTKGNRTIEIMRPS